MVDEMGNDLTNPSWSQIQDMGMNSLGASAPASGGVANPANPFMRTGYHQNNVWGPGHESSKYPSPEEHVAGSPAPAASTASPAASLFANVNPNARGMRNNNPGNLVANSYTAKMPGYVGSDGRFAKFSSPEQGVEALKQNLSNYASKGISTPFDIASTWAPAAEATNDPNSYGSVIANELGVKLTDKINLTDPAVQAKVARAIIKVENGVGGGMGSGANVASGGDTSRSITVHAGNGKGSVVAGGQGANPSSGIASGTVSNSPIDNPKGLYTLSLLQSLWPKTKFTPIDYDPFKVMQTGENKA